MNICINYEHFQQVNIHRHHNLGPYQLVPHETNSVDSQPNWECKEISVVQWEFKSLQNKIQISHISEFVV